MWTEADISLWLVTNQAIDVLQKLRDDAARHWTELEGQTLLAMNRDRAQSIGITGTSLDRFLVLLKQIQPTVSEEVSRVQYSCQSKAQVCAASYQSLCEQSLC